MAPSPVASPSQNKNNSSSSVFESSLSEANPPSSSTNSSPPPASPPPPEKKTPSPPPPKASSPPPPSPKPSPPPPEKKTPSPSPSPSPPLPSPPPPEPAKNPPEEKKNPPPPPTVNKTPEKPKTPPSGPFSPPPPHISGQNAPPPRTPNALVPPLAPGTRGPSGPPGSSNTEKPVSEPNQPSRKMNPPSSGSPSPPSSSNTTTIAIVSGVGVALGILVIALAIFCLVCGRKKKRSHYYMDGPPPGKEYYSPGPKPHWNTTPQDHVVRLTPQPGMMHTPGGPVGGWVPHGTPGQHNTTKDFSSGTTPQNQFLSPGGNMALGFSKSQFSYEELAAATADFSKANLLGQGGFGFVHKGVLPNGQEVAVKSLKVGSGQGEREFQAEVEIISRVHHRHLVSLVGYCIADGQRMLVYEFVANQTMEFHLHGKNRPVMDWPTRLRIALGSAKGLGYLHEDCHPRIIHRDIKAANILLDNRYEAMVADFGLAKLSSDNFTHISTRVMGTFGYMAPEYASSGKLTDKSDVFSFGVMLLELITGRRPLDLSGKYMEDDSLVDWARPLLTKAIELGEYKELVDPQLGDNYNPQEMKRMVACAAASIRHSARRRPKMSQIVRALDGDSSLDDLNDGGRGGAKDGNTEHYDTSAYNADMTKFRQMVMTTQEFTSSEYNPSSSSSEFSRELNGHSGGYAARNV